MGFIHIYCGDGKGKTTAAIGLAVRAAGSGKKVHIVQFLKGSKTSELNSLRMISDITVSRCDKNYGFIFNMNDEDKQQLTICHNDLLLTAKKMIEQNEIDLLILDEFNATYEYNLFDCELAEKIVLSKDNDVEFILTGRNPQQKFLDAASYVSEINAVKHPYTTGITAREGIEF